MPIYEYICSKCGCEFEKLVPRFDAVVECEQCGCSEVEKQFSVFAAASSAPSGARCEAADSCPAAGGCGCHGKCGCGH